MATDIDSFDTATFTGKLMCYVCIGNNTGAFTLGVWSESHDVLGIVDDVDTFYFIKSNGEELLRIERRHLKTTLPIVGLFVPDVTETRGSLL